MIVEAAKIYQARGWSPVPIAARGKRPLARGWNHPGYHAAAKEYAGRNIGIRCGSLSGMVCVDLDTPEAIAMGPELLPRTDLVHGRKSSPTSHYWYACPDPQGGTSFRSPGGGVTYLDLLGTGRQCVAPPSIHSTGEVIEWEMGDTPSQATWGELVAAAGRLAAACYLVADRGWTQGKALEWAKSPTRQRGIDRKILGWAGVTTSSSPSRSTPTPRTRRKRTTSTPRRRSRVTSVACSPVGAARAKVAAGHLGLMLRKAAQDKTPQWQRAAMAAAMAGYQAQAKGDK